MNQYAELTQGNEHNTATVKRAGMFTYVVPAFVYLAITSFITAEVIGPRNIIDRVQKGVAFASLLESTNDNFVYQIGAIVGLTVYAVFALWILGNILSGFGSIVIEEIFIGRFVGYPFERILGLWPRHTPSASALSKFFICYFHLWILVICVWKNALCRWYVRY